MLKDEPPPRHKKRLKSAFARGSNSTAYNVQNLRVTNKCLSQRLGSMRERLQKVQNHNTQLRKQNSELRDQIRELKQNPMLNKFTDIQEYIEDLKNKMFLLNSITSGALETVVDLSEMCLPGKSTETGVRSSVTTTFSSIPCEEQDVSAYQSPTDAACSVFDDSESTFKMAFPDGDRASLRHRPLRQTYFRRKLCLSSSEDVSALSHEFAQTSKSASSAYICENEFVNYFEKFKNPDACVTTATAQYQQRKNNVSALKVQTLEAWVDTAKCQDSEIISDNEMLLLKSVNSSNDEQQQSGCNIEIASSNSPKLTEFQSSPVKQNQKRNVGRRQRNKSKSKTFSLRKDNNPVIIPYTGNLRTSKTVQKAVPTLKKSSLCSGKTKLKKSDDINPTTNQPLNSKLSPPACSKDKINMESGVSKSNSFKVGRPEHTMKAPLFDVVASPVPKSQKFRKDNKNYRNTSGTFPKTRLKSGKQKLPEHCPLFLNAEKQKLDCVLSMRGDELTFSPSSFKHTDETLSNNYETFSVDRLSKINCTISSRKVQLGENLAHSLRLKDNSNSMSVDSHGKLQAHATRSNDCEGSKIETNEDTYGTENWGSATLVSPAGVKIDNPQCADDDFQKRCIENSADNVKQKTLFVAMSTDCSNGWVIKKGGLNSAELRKYNDFKQSENEQDIKSRENRRRCPVKDATIKKHNQNTRTQKQINIRGKNKDKSVFTSIPGTTTKKSKSSYTRPHSAMLETKRSFEGKEVKGDKKLFSCPNACKINKLLQKVKRPHSVGCIRSKTKLFDYERIAKTKPSTRAKSLFKPINMPHDGRQRMNIRGERKTTRGRLVSPCLPINESYQGTTMKNKTGTRSMSLPGRNREICPDSMTESLPIVSIETQELTQSTATMIESRERQHVI